MLIVFFLMAITNLRAQNITGERRVYYLDATYSMVSNKLWEPSKDNLIKAIENIEDVNTELVVIVFADDVNSKKKVWKKWEIKATTSDKDKLIKEIEGLAKPVTSSMTNLYDPWNDFYSEIKKDKVNYMFLMTDGGHEQGGDFFGLIDQWKRRTNSYTYGFFVELTENVGSKEVKARDKARIHIDRQKERLWRVSSADININLIRLGKSVTYNVRGDKYIDIPLFFSGKDKSAINKLIFEFENNSDFKIRKIDFLNNIIRVFIDNNINIHSYPTDSRTSLRVKLDETNDKIKWLSRAVIGGLISGGLAILFLLLQKSLGLK